MSLVAARRVDKEVQKRVDEGDDDGLPSYAKKSSLDISGFKTPRSPVNSGSGGSGSLSSPRHFSTHSISKTPRSPKERASGGVPSPDPMPFKSLRDWRVADRGSMKAILASGALNNDDDDVDLEDGEDAVEVILRNARNIVEYFELSAYTQPSLTEPPQYPEPMVGPLPPPPPQEQGGGSVGGAGVGGGAIRSLFPGALDSNA